MKVAVLGGTGFIGSHIATCLAQQSIPVRIVTHRKKPVGGSAFEYVDGAITNQESLWTAFHGCSAVIHAVGLIVESGTSTYERVVVQGTSHVLAACHKQGIAHIIYISALGTSQSARSKYHQAKYAAEQTIISSGIPYTIFRPSVVYGKEDKFINMLVSMIRYLPIVPVVGDGMYELQPIFVDDFAEMIASALIRPESRGKTLNAAGPETMTFRELLGTIKKTIGKRRASVYLPLSLMRSVATVGEKLLATPPVTRDQLIMLQEGNTGDIAETVRLLGVTPQKLADVLSTYVR